MSQKNLGEDSFTVHCSKYLRRALLIILFYIHNIRDLGVRKISKIIKEEGRGLLLHGIANRPAIYPTILNALSQNYFSSLKDAKVLEEIANNFLTLKEILYGK